MQDEPRKVTTFCPQCGQPIVWSVQPFPGGELVADDLAKSLTSWRRSTAACSIAPSGCWAGYLPIAN